MAMAAVPKAKIFQVFVMAGLRSWWRQWNRVVRAVLWRSTQSAFPNGRLSGLTLFALRGPFGQSFAVCD